MNWILQHKLLLIIAIVVFVGGAWYSLSQSGGSSALLTTETATVDGSASQGLVGTLLALRAVTLSGTIFSEPAFVSLQDFGTTIVPEPVGRDNPFAPVSSQATTTQTPRAAQIFAPRR
jgi:hypothetical protein